MRTLLLVLLAGILGLAAPRVGSAAPVGAAESAACRVRIIRRLPAQDARDQRIVLEVLSKASGQRREITVEAPFLSGAPPDLLIWGEGLVLLGRDTEGGKIVRCGLRPPCPQAKVIRCLGYAISPRKNRVVYENWQYRFLPETMSTVLSVLSFNRKRIVDQVVFPHENARSQVRVAHLSDPSQRRAVVSPVLWSADGGSLVFAERQAGRNYLVRLVLASPGSISYRRPVNARELAAETSEDPELGFGVETLSWSGPREVKAKLVEQSYWNQRVVALHLPIRRKRLLGRPKQRRHPGARPR